MEDKAMNRFLIAAAFLFATIFTAQAATSGTAHRQIDAQKHPQTAIVRDAAPRRTKSSGGYDQNRGAYDPWYWDWSYGR
jgi:hypothetical protein